MNEPRYVVGSVTGYGAEGGNNSKPRTMWGIRDSHDCYRVVWEFNKIAGEKARLSAQKLADDLNSGEKIRERVAEKYITDMGRARRNKFNKRMGIEAAPRGRPRKQTA